MAKFEEIGSFDYRVLNRVFARLLSDKLGLVLVEANGHGQQPEAPFVSLDIISPYIPIDEYFDETDQEAFEAVVSFTSFGLDKSQALQVTQAIRKILTQFDTSLTLNASNIVLVEMMPTNVRSVPETVLDKHMVGFDARLRLRETFTDKTVETIAEVDI